MSDIVLIRDCDHRIPAPEWGFNVLAQPLTAGPSARIQIDFTASTNVKYGVRFAQRMGDPWTAASFATSSTGPANQTSLTGSGGPVSVYLDRVGAAGFFAVEMELAAV